MPSNQRKVWLESQSQGKPVMISDPFRATHAQDKVMLHKFLPDFAIRSDAE